MKDSDIALGVIILSQTVVGGPGNSCLLHHYLLHYLTGCRLRSTDWILQHLIAANLLTILFRGVPHTMSAFGLKDFLDDFGCKVTFYLYRIGRGMSMSSTCILSVVQAITISPNGSRLSQLKVKSQSYIASFIYLSWILALISNYTFPKNMIARHRRNVTYIKHYEYCSSVGTGEAGKILFTVSHICLDVFYIGLMLWSSGIMVCILYRHKQRMKHIHRSNVSLRSSPESRATKTILLLVTTFVCFYAYNCNLQPFLNLLYNPGSLLVNMSMVVSACFPTLSCFLLMNHQFCESPFCFACARNRRYNHISNI